MAAAERMIATKGAIMSLLIDAYQKRDRVGLVVFQKEEARTVLPPTSSVELAQKALKDVPVGGKTPLSAGLLLAHQILVREQIRDPEVMPLMIVVTDGAGNVSHDRPAAAGRGAPHRRDDQQSRHCAPSSSTPSTKPLTAASRPDSPKSWAAMSTPSSSCAPRNSTPASARTFCPNETTTTKWSYLIRLPALRLLNRAVVSHPFIRSLPLTVSRDTATNVRNKYSIANARCFA